MIKKGTVQVNGSKFCYDVKCFDKPSEFGIGEGRISKLEIRNDGHVVCGYDRGWYDVPASSTAKAALQNLIKKVLDIIRPLPYNIDIRNKKKEKTR